MAYASMVMMMTRSVKARELLIAFYHVLLIRYACILVESLVNKGWIFVFFNFCCNYIC